MVHKCDKFEVNRADPLIIFNGYPENIIKGKFIDPYYKYSYEEYSGDTCSFFKAIVMIGEDGLLIGYDYYGDKTEFTAKISDDLKTVYHLPKNGTYRTESGHEVVIDIDHNKNIQVRLANGKVYKYIGEKITGNTWTDSFTTFEFKNSKSESLRYFKIVLDKFTGVLRIDGDDLTIVR